MDEMQGLARIRNHHGKLDEFKRLAARCVELVQANDTGTLAYSIFLNDQGSEAIVYERYRDSEAGLVHAKTVAEITKSITEIADLTGVVWGEPNPELRKMLGEAGVQIYAPLVSI